MQITRRTLGLGLIGTVGAAFTSSCSNAQGVPAGADVRAVDAEGLGLVEMSAARDWATFPDHISLVTVVAEHRLAATDYEISVGEGYIPRQVDVELLEDISSLRVGGRAVPQRMSWVWGGWLFSKDKPERRLRIDSRGGTGEVGRQYVAALAFSGFGSVESAEQDKRWGCLYMFSAEGGVIKERSGLVDVPSFARQLIGKRVAAFGDLVATTAPYPAAAAVMDRDLSVRAAAVRHG